ncbi:MAG: anti-sigma regulatory factor (Ser/Thr protein kinase) [Verrucomicrobiales bacterium]|jgi:anti-sigma regulatory factor (Ser/Thr protein kinase)
MKAEFESLSDSQDKLGRAPEFLALSSECQFAIRLVLDEIASNVIKYDARRESPVTIEMKFWVEDGEMIVSLKNDGQPFSPLELQEADPDEKLARLEPGGLGLYLIKKSVDEICWRREDGKNHLLARKSLENHRSSPSSV